MKKVSSLKNIMRAPKIPEDPENASLDPGMTRNQSFTNGERKSVSPRKVLDESDTFHLPRSLSNFLGKGSGTWKRKKDRNVSILANWRDEDDAKSQRSTLPPPMPPIAPAPRLRRVNSSTMSLGANKKRIMTVEELYVEILYSILHMIGCDAERDEQALLIEHLQEAFHFEDDKHSQLLDIATMREEPYLKANLEIVEARNLIGKDMSGSSDPFCTFYLTTNPLSRFNTSYKARTLSPVWNEEFVLDVNSVDQDSLRIDIWDFNPEENVSDKFRKINEIKDSRGLRKFIKETMNASAGKTTHGLIGSVEIPLRDVPSSGMHTWLTLEKPEAKSKKKRGEVNIGLALSTEKDQNLTSQEHKHLLKILFAHELQHDHCEPFAWNGSFLKESVTILAQHAVQGKLTGAETALARWLVYAHTHCDLPLDYRVFHPILEKLHYAITHNLFHSDDETNFVETAVIFTHHATEFLRKHRQYVANHPELSLQVEYILKCLKLISNAVEGREGPSQTGKPGETTTEQRHYTNLVTPGHMRVCVSEAVTDSFQDWYRYVVDALPIESTRALRIKSTIALVRSLVSDLKTECRQGHEIFVENLQIDYMRIAFDIYQKELVEVAKDLVESTCSKLQPIIFSENFDHDYASETLTIGTSLFELYLALQQMTTMGQDIYGDVPPTEFMINHTWFNQAVPRWLDIALYKAMQRIIKAVELDNLEPVDDLVQHSSSAVDIRTVLLQIKTFWKQLNWPDVEASYAYISKILDDVCKTSIFYAEHMCRRVALEQQELAQTGGKYEVTPSLCLAINNIDYVLNFIKPFVTDLGMEETLAKLEALNGEMVANSCRRTLTTLVQNAVEDVENKIFEVVDTVGEKMAPVIQKFLVEGSALVAYAGRDKVTLIQYLDKNMIVLKEKLNDANFEKVLSVIWESSALSLSDTIHLSIERQKPPSYFKTLLDILKVLINFFYGDKIPHDETLMKMKDLLQTYAADSTELISRYLWARHEHQKAIMEADWPLGSITIRCQLLKEHLRVEILNGRNLKPPDPQAIRVHSKHLPPIRSRSYNSALSRSSMNLEWVKSKFKSIRANLHEASIHFHAQTHAGQCDPYATVRLVPEGKFSFAPKFKTKTQRRTFFPLFDETFDFVLGPSQPNRFQDAFIQITIKDRGVLPGNDFFIGEIVIPFADVQKTDLNKKLSELPQIQFPLTKPEDLDSDIIIALESRHFDRAAKVFLQKERKKI